jgi:hypothetical protein
MAVVPEGFDTSRVKSTGKERKCGTCKNFTVKPPEVELARYALPIGACGPGIHCLGGAVRGMCQAKGVLTESTNMVPNVPCGGSSYVPGGPSVMGAEGLGSPNRGPVEKAKGFVLEAADDGRVLAVGFLGLIELVRRVRGG